MVLPVSAQEPHALLKSAIGKSGANKEEILAALQRVPANQKEGMEFLITYMPERDLKSLSADFLLENVELAYRARMKTAWGQQIPKKIFFNDVLPYANINESRDTWRKGFLERFLPVVSECKTPSEAAQILNETVFKTLNVKYSTKRKRADQGPRDSIESGLASCTGLSILLTDACRAVGVPARLAGIPKWANKPGNHTWVEIWDKGWHFTGAAEPSDKGLNHTWFQGDAALARVESRMSAIYAVSYKSTGTSFPLVWAPHIDWVHAINVTNRYTPKSAHTDGCRLMVRVWNSTRTERVAAAVKVQSIGNEPLEGRSRDEGFDTNDFLTFDVAPGKSYDVEVAIADSRVSQAVEVGKKKQIVVDFVLPRVSDQ